MKLSRIVHTVVAIAGLGLIWFAHSSPLMILQTHVLIPLIFVGVLGPALFQLWDRLRGGVIREESDWIDRRID